LSQINKYKFQEVFKQYYNPLCNFAASIVKDDRLAQDVVQDVFTHLWDKRDSISVEDNEKNYLFTAVKNKAIEKLRKLYSESQLADSIKLMISVKTVENQIGKAYRMLRELLSGKMNEIYS